MRRAVPYPTRSPTGGSERECLMSLFIGTGEFVHASMHSAQAFSENGKRPIMSRPWRTSKAVAVRPSLVRVVGHAPFGGVLLARNAFWLRLRRMK
jgi:hypothetical protein